MIEIIELIGTLIPLLYLQGCLDDSDDYDGTPIEIRTKNELLNIELDKNYKLMNNIDFDGDTINRLLSNGYSGTFDGNSFEIRNFTINLLKDYVSLFAKLNDNGIIMNLGISGNCSITGYMYVGGLVGYNNGTIKNCYNVMNANISCSSAVGGLAGYNNLPGTIENCYNAMNGNITGNNKVGGLVGVNYGNIQNCYNSMTGIPDDEGNLISIIGTENGVGGLVGYNEYGNITNCYNAMNGNITGNDKVGGLVGYNSYGTIENSYNAMNGSITGDNYGDIVGDNEENATISNCYNAMNGWNDSDVFNGSNEALIYDSGLVWHDFDGDNNPYGLTVFTVSPWVGYNSHDSKPTLES